MEPELEPFRATLQGVAIESTFNWYWLVDGLRAHDFPAVLVNTAAIQQYSGLKHSIPFPTFGVMRHLR